jgi:hypothetical protein
MTDRIGLVEASRKGLTLYRDVCPKNAKLD